MVGGFLFAAVALALRRGLASAFEFDTTLQTPLMIAFFTTIGLGASLGLLKIGGPQVVLFWVLATLLAVLQNGVGVRLANGLGVHPLLGLIAGSITMTGGHGTGAAFGKLMEEQYQFPGAVTLAMAAATFGLVSGGLLGGPIGTRLMTRFGLTSPAAGPAPAAGRGRGHAGLDSEIDTEPAGEAPTAYRLLKTLTVILVACGPAACSPLARAVRHAARLHRAMLVAAVLRNVADATGSSNSTSASWTTSAPSPCRCS